MPCVSIIVPVFNSEHYLSRCIESILAQSLSNFELLLIDDGSSDKSGEICEKYAACDKRVRVFHQQNKGVSAARNLGLDNESGKYTCFIDSDDWVDPDFLLNMIAPNVDIMVIDFYRGDSFIERQGCPSNITSKGMINSLVSEELFGVMWNKCIKSSIIQMNHIRFDEDVNFGEDVLFLSKLFLTGEYTIVFSNRASYHYSDNTESISRKFNHNSLMRRLCQFNHLCMILDYNEYHSCLTTLYNHIFWDSFSRGNVMLKDDFKKFHGNKFLILPSEWQVGALGKTCYYFARFGFFRLSQFFVNKLC